MVYVGVGLSQGISMDLFDDFEMKPITKGLGFHKKTTSLKKEVENSGLIDKKLNTRIPSKPAESFLNTKASADSPMTYEDLLKSLSSTEETRASESIKDQFQHEPGLEFSKTLPTKRSAKVKASSVEVPRDIPSTFPMPDMVDNITPPKVKRNKITSLPEPGSRLSRSSSNSPVDPLVKAPICLRSIFLDTVVVIAMSLLFVISLVTVTEVQLSRVIFNAKSDLPTQASMLLLFLAVFQMYVIVARSFFGRTLGEWTFDYQLGKNEEQERALYPIRVVWRSFVVIVTGIFVLPLLSFIIRKDIVGFFSGLQLYRHRDA